MAEVLRYCSNSDRRIGIVRVDVSIDGGKNWQTAELINPTNQKPNRAWAWSLWQVNVAVPKSFEGKLDICCKATDSSFNVQPETLAPYWNLRGVLTNAWHHASVQISPPVLAPLSKNTPNRSSVTNPKK